MSKRLKPADPVLPLPKRQLSAETIRRKRVGESAKQRSGCPAMKNVRRVEKGRLSSCAHIWISFHIGILTDWSER